MGVNLLCFRVMTQKNKLTQVFQLQIIFCLKITDGSNTITKSQDIINTVFFAAVGGGKVNVCVCVCVCVVHS
jgi:predicted nucleic acid binding AN1-type Zn finger protein